MSKIEHSCFCRHLISNPGLRKDLLERSITLLRSSYQQVRGPPGFFDPVGRSTMSLACLTITQSFQF